MSSPSLSVYCEAANGGYASRPRCFNVTAGATAYIGATLSIFPRKLIITNTHATLNLLLSTRLDGPTVYVTIYPGSSYVVEPTSSCKVWTDELALTSEDGRTEITALIWAWL